MQRFGRKRQEAAQRPPSNQTSRNETKARRATRLITGAASVASKVMQTVRRSRKSRGSVAPVEVSIVPASSGSTQKGEQRNRKSLFQRGRDLVGSFSPRKSKSRSAQVKTAELEKADSITRIESFSDSESLHAIDLQGAVTTPPMPKPKAVPTPKLEGTSALTVISLEEEEIMQRIRMEEAQLAKSQSRRPSNNSAFSSSSTPSPGLPPVGRSHASPFAKKAEASHKSKKHALTPHSVVDDRTDDWTCWHVTPIDVIIDFQLYELLQNKWRFKVPELLEDKKESEAEIIADMMNKRRLVKEELDGDAKHTCGFKTKLISKFMERVFGNIERCILVEQDYAAFLEITFGRLVDFNPKEHLHFVMNHKELSKDYRNLMKPSTDNSDDDLLHELRKPEMSAHEAQQLREVFLQLDKYNAGVVDVQELKHHNDFCVADFDSFEFMETLDFDVFSALVCPSTHRTMSTVWEIIIKKMRSRLEQIRDMRSDGMSLAETLASLEDPLLPTLPPQIHCIYQQVYDELDWDSSSCLTTWIKSGIKHLIEEPGAIGYGLRLDNSGRLSLAEFTGFVCLDGYKRFGKAPPSTSHRQAITGAELSSQLSDWSSRPGRRH